MAAELITPAPITPRPGALDDYSFTTALIHPDRDSVAHLEEGRIRLFIPALSSETTFQITLDSSMGRCENDPPRGYALACLSVEAFDADGKPVERMRLREAARLTLTIPPSVVNGYFGDSTSAMLALLRGETKTLRQIQEGDGWREVHFAFDVDASRGIELDIQGLRLLGRFSVVDTSNPTPTPAPTPTASPMPTITPTPTAAPVEPPESAAPPDAGGERLSANILSAIAMCGIVAALWGLAILFGARRARSNPQDHSPAAG